MPVLYSATSGYAVSLLGSDPTSKEQWCQTQSTQQSITGMAGGLSVFLFSTSISYSLCVEAVNVVGLQDEVLDTQLDMEFVSLFPLK